MNPRRLPRILAIALLLGVIGQPALAATTRCWSIQTTTALDISAGAVTAPAFIALEGQVNLRDKSPYPNYLKVGVDIVDASDEITKIRLTFTAAEARGGPFRNTILCSDAAPVLTCGQVKLDWNPKTDGKNWWFKPVDWGWPYGIVKVTPTGHGAGDTAKLTIIGCTE